MALSHRVFGLVFLALLAGAASAQETVDYQMPPQAMVDIADAAPTPGIVVDPTKTWLLVLERRSLSSIRELAEPELRLAGLRIQPATNARSRRRVATHVELVAIADGSTRSVTGLPSGGRIVQIDDASFSPDGRLAAFSLTTAAGMELWILDVASGAAKRVLEDLNGVFRGRPYAWLSDSRSLVAKVVPEGRGPPPEAPSVPSGPIVQEARGTKSAARTYQDLLTSHHDEALFEHYGKAQVVRVSVEGAVHKLGAPGLVARAEPSPEGEHILVERLERPFSYLVPYYRFGHRVEVLDMSGALVSEVARLPLAEDVAIGRNAVRTGRRDFGWRADADATLYWIEATDGGDPRAEAKFRDAVYTWRAPFDGEPKPLISLGLRFADVHWGSDAVALVEEWWWATRTRRVFRVKPGTSDEPPKMVFDYSYEDRYNAPGSPLMTRTARGSLVLATSADGQSIYLRGEGASPEGNRPFIDALDLESGAKTRLFHSEAPYYEMPITWIDAEAGHLLTRRESRDEPPNYFVHASGDVRAVTHFSNPYPGLEGVGRELVRYDREDGVTLTATLYTPAGYTSEDGPLPMLVWAYPREYKSASAAAQVRDSPYRFSRVSWGSPLYWLTQGYAVMEGATMPIIGEGDVEPNDTYVEQLVASGRAAVDEAVRRGIADRERVGIAGHSYGAFMTANLLAHSDTFRAGIARSGAYNRTLTPFGFQSEQRTYWEAPEIYFAMSPFMHAQKIDEPILLIHGVADNNSGTFPIQSRRLYHALKGHGATARLVMLPHESHGYQARESVMHTLWEMNVWLDKYVKNAPPRNTTSEEN